MCVGADVDEIDGMEDAGVALLRAFNYITEELDAPAAFDTIISVSRSDQ